MLFEDLHPYHASLNVAAEKIYSHIKAWIRILFFSGVTFPCPIPGNIAISVAMNSSYFQNYNLALNTVAGKLFEIIQDESIVYQEIDQF